MSYYGVLLTENGSSLSHHGIKGQRWGLRRFQDEDGTLTEAGKARYGVSSGDGKISGVASKAASGKAKKENPTDEKKQKRKDFLKKAAVGLGAAALVGASAAALKKSTDLRNDMRRQATERADMAASQKRRAIENAKESLKDSKMLRDRARMIRDMYPGHDTRSGYERSMAVNRRTFARDWADMARRSGIYEKEYRSIAVSTTRRKAVANYIKNRGKIVI